jgi:hypothetical protein
MKTPADVYRPSARVYRGPDWNGTGAQYAPLTRVAAQTHLSMTITVIVTDASSGGPIGGASVFSRDRARPRSRRLMHAQ